LGKTLWVNANVFPQEAVFVTIKTTQLPSDKRLPQERKAGYTLLKSPFLIGDMHRVAAVAAADEAGQ